MIRRIRAGAEDRLLLRSEIGDGGCWVYTGARDREGYGRIQVDGLSKRAPRVMFEIRKGPIPEGLVVMHSCDNPACINPEHLSIGTQAENIADRERKGRGYRKRRSDAKVSVEQVLEIARRLEAGGRAADLAREYGVSKTTIYSTRTKIEKGRV